MKKIMTIIILLLLSLTVNATITVSDPWIEIHSDPAKTETAIIFVNGFNWLEFEDVNIEIGFALR